MKNLKFNFKNYIFNLVVILAIAAFFMPITATVLAVSATLAFVTGTVASFVSTGVAFMAIQVEIWQNHIEEELFKDNEFLRHSHKADGNVINARVVHIPQSGGSGNVVKNRAALPANVRKRTDTDVVYVLDEFTTDPVLIPNADTHELSYDKRASVLGEDMDKLKETVAEETLYCWTHSTAITGYAGTSLPATSIKETTGAATAATAPSATGNRKKATRADIQAMKVFLKKQRRWLNGRMYCLLTPDMEADIFPADDLVTVTAQNKVTEEERRLGVAYVFQGFKIMTRDTVLRVNGAGTILTPEAVGSATDDEASLFWQEKAVEFAMGGVEAFEKLGDPQYYGDLYSFLARSGARARRVGYEGIAVLKQAKTA